MSQRRLSVRRLLSAGLLVSALLVASVGTAVAAEFRSGDSVTVARNETIDDDLFLSGSTVYMNGTVKGNLFITAGEAVINGTVVGSLFVVAQSLTVNGKVNGSVYSGAFSVVLLPQAAIARNVMVGAYAVEADKGSIIGRDAYIGASQAELGGTVLRDVRFAGNGLVITGQIGGDLMADVSSPSARVSTPFFDYWPNVPAAIQPGLQVAPGASIAGKLTYASPVKQASAIQGSVGAVEFQQTQPSAEEQASQRRQEQVRRQPSWASPVNWLLNRLREFITLFVLGWLALKLAPKHMRAAAEKAHTAAGPSLGWGILVAIGGYLIAFLAAIVLLTASIILAVLTLGQLSVTVFVAGFAAWGALLVGFQLLVSFGSKLVIAYLLGRLILVDTAKRSAVGTLWPLAIGVLLYILIASIPCLGWFVWLLATLIGLGAIWLTARDSAKSGAV